MGRKCQSCEYMKTATYREPGKTPIVRQVCEKGKKKILVCREKKILKKERE